MEIYIEDIYGSDAKKLITMDRYDTGLEHFEVAGMNLMAEFKNEKLLCAINQLSPRQKEVILLSAVENETDTRIAFYVGLQPFDYQPSIWKILVESIIY